MYIVILHVYLTCVLISSLKKTLFTVLTASLYIKKEDYIERGYKQAFQ